MGGQTIFCYLRELDFDQSWSYSDDNKSCIRTVGRMVFRQLQQWEGAVHTKRTMERTGGSPLVFPLSIQPESWVGLSCGGPMQSGHFAWRDRHTRMGGPTSSTHGKRHAGWPGCSDEGYSFPHREGYSVTPCAILGQRTQPQEGDPISNHLLPVSLMDERLVTRMAIPNPEKSRVPERDDKVTVFINKGKK